MIKIFKEQRFNDKTCLGDGTFPNSYEFFVEILSAEGFRERMLKEIC